ncbi:heavy-metal-associated domain-containing protein [Pedobacter sp. SYSU D00535]|uniref:heavy-metal-associated domain-containing protein n=1 Tax=Pedobacter sp. SYSU D00535 TaxID=2810308 RepID=UPI001A96FD9E|nr:heavy-metal-associated domain-containing protein [Pedobacter sp. SYSU D00535]
MEKYQFKTNINCGGCVAKVTPQLNGNSAITRWEVDTNNPDKILTVEGDGLQPEEVEQLVAKVGFSAEQIS